MVVEIEKNAMQPCFFVSFFDFLSVFFLFFFFFFSSRVSMVWIVPSHTYFLLSIDSILGKTSSSVDGTYFWKGLKPRSMSVSLSKVGGPAVGSSEK